MEKLLEIQRIILGQLEAIDFHSRKVFESFRFDNRSTAIVGSRGVGKTTYLLHLCQEQNRTGLRALYVSADNIHFVEQKLLDLVDSLYKETEIRMLLVDEIHKYHGWQREIKNIADTYLDFKVVFTGSSQIDLTQGQIDLSRRVTRYHLHGLSFREYLAFNRIMDVEIQSLQDCLENHEDIVNLCSRPDILRHFKAYLHRGYFPFASTLKGDPEFYQALENSIQKTIYEDIATFHNIKTATLNIIEKLYKYVLNSSPGELSAYKISSSLGKDFESVSTYFQYLNQAGLVRFLFPKKTGQAYLRNPAKMYPDNTNQLFAAYLPQSSDNLSGKQRETFALSHLQNAGYKVFYKDSGDFYVNNYTLEVGGKNKSAKQIQDVDGGYVLADGILGGRGRKVPLYLLGFLY